MTMKRNASVAVIGDLLGSRGSGDRAALHRALARAVDEVNARLDPATPLRITVGDEYQGVFDTVGEAVHATLLVRLMLLPDHDVRHGLGRGETTVLAEDPRVEDGPAWWAARDAIEAVEAAEARAATRRLRTAYVVAPGVEGPEAGAVNAALVLRDEVVSGLSARAVSVLRGLLSGEAQRDIADRLGISPSAVSQRIRADGLAAVVAADELIREVS